MTEETIDRVSQPIRFLLWGSSVAFFLAIVVTALIGCSGGSSVRSTPGRTTIEHTRQSVDAAGQPVTERTSAVAVGPAISATGEGIDQAVATGAPELSIPGIADSSGGGLDSRSKLTAASRGPIVLYGFGGLLIAGGALVAVWGGAIPLGLGLAAAGLCLIAVGYFLESAPWVIYLAGLAGLGGLGYWAWYTIKGKQTAETLGAVVKGIEIAKVRAPDAAAAVTESILRASDAAGVSIRGTVEKVRRNADKVL